MLVILFASLFPDVISWVLDDSMGCPGPKGMWPPWMTITYHISNLAIGFSQISLPCAVAVKWRYRRDGVSPQLFWSVLLFLPMMALSRFARVAEIVGPLYNLTSVLDAMTAILSVYSAIRLPKLINEIMKLPSRNEIHKALNKAQTERLEKELHAAITEKKYQAIRHELDVARSIISNKLWLQDKMTVLDAMDRITALCKSGDDVNGGG